jgi:hypothetical protein
MRIFGQVSLVEKQKVSNLRKTRSKEFEFLVTMTFQYGGYFGFN